MTSVILAFIKYVLRIPLRMTDEHLEIGDDAIHGEEAYALFFEGQRSHVYGDMGRSPTSESGVVSAPILGMAVGDGNANANGATSRSDEENGVKKE